MRCPLCDHEQSVGPECDVCGKVLGAAGPAAAAPLVVAPLDGLEQTGSAPVGAVSVEPVAEIEVTRRPAQPVSVELLPELDAARAPDDGARTARPEGPVPCRYCQHVQATGRLCERCGMRLPWSTFSASGSTGRVDVGPGEEARCRSCGAPSRAGTRCSECGNQVPPAGG